MCNPQFQQLSPLHFVDTASLYTGRSFRFSDGRTNFITLDVSLDNSKAALYTDYLRASLAEAETWIFIKSIDQNHPYVSMSYWKAVKKAG